MSGFFEFVGVVTVALFVTTFLAVVYTLFIHPVFQAISIMRWACACEKLIDPEKKITLRVLWAMFKWGYVVGSNHGIRYHNRFGEWSGIGKWRIYEDEDE